jgi:predicted DNA-binding transcriptional regulator YafY
LKEDGDELLVRFHSGGLLELANHLFAWAGDLVIEEPSALREVMARRLLEARRCLVTSRQRLMAIWSPNRN